MKNFPAVLMTIMLLLSFSAFAQNDDLKLMPDNKPIPVLVLFEFNVWTQVSGTDMPDFVLYEDGTVIYNDAKESYAFRYVTAKLSTDEVNQIMDKISAPEFENYKPHYSICDKCATTDLPSPFIMLKQKDGTYKTVATYGSLSEKAAPEYRVVDIPKSLVDAFYFLRNYETPKASVWQTDFIEAIVWKYDGESKKNVKWNKALPDLNDSRTVSFKKSDTQYYSIFVPEAKEKPFALSYYKLRRSKGALLMQGQRWNLTFRFPFPSEEVWLRGSDGKTFRESK